MARVKQQKKLKKELRLFDVFAIATGTTLSAGFFLLPGLAARQAGPAMVLAYIIAALPLIPAMFSIIELATAMPRAGGVYYFLDRTLGPVFGTVGGLGTFLALTLKVAFALVGLGAYVRLFFPDLPSLPVAVALAVAIGILNAFGSKKSGSFQVILVIGLLAILVAFIGGGIPQVDYARLEPMFDVEAGTILSTAGLVYISYVGVTKIASLSEELSNPERTMPLGVIYALSTAILIYALGTAVMVGVLPMDQLQQTLTPVAAAGKVIFGETGELLLSIAALFAFISVANAGTLSASRYPLAMSRDHILPRIFRKIGKSGTPFSSLLLTVVVIITFLVLFDPTGIAKLASAFQLLMFALTCVAVIIMRESKLHSYDPGFRSPWYPWMQIFGIISSLILIVEMGWLPMLFTLGIIAVSVVWYRLYAHDKVLREGAIYHVFERLGKRRYEALDSELRGIMKEKGRRKGDPFEEIVMRSHVIDLQEGMSFEKVVNIASEWLAKVVPMRAMEIKQQFMEGAQLGATPVARGVALPHFRAEGISESILVLVRAQQGVEVDIYNPISHEKEESERVNALFFLVSPEDNPTLHLRMLAFVAGRMDEEDFMEEWKAASDEAGLREALLHDERFFGFDIRSGQPSEKFMNQMIREIKIPEGCLIALINRGSETIIPKGSTELLEGDRLTIIGEPYAIKEMRELCGR